MIVALVLSAVTVVTMSAPRTPRRCSRRRRSRAPARRPQIRDELGRGARIDIVQADRLDAEQVVEGERLELALRAVADQRHHAAVPAREAAGRHHRGGGGAHGGGQRELAEQLGPAGVDIGEHAEGHHGGQAGAGVPGVAVDVLEAVGAASAIGISSITPSLEWLATRAVLSKWRPAREVFLDADEGAEAGGQARPTMAATSCVVRSSVGASVHGLRLRSFLDSLRRDGNGNRQNCAIIGLFCRFVALSAECKMDDTRPETHRPAARRCPHLRGHSRTPGRLARHGQQPHREARRTGDRRLHGLRPDIEHNEIPAWMSIAVEGNQTRKVIAAARRARRRALHDTNGRWDLLAELRCASADLAAVLERIRLIKGIHATAIR